MTFREHDRRVPVYQVDAFTGEPYRGNPAAVCVLEEWPADELLQKVAAEMNLSETAFIVGRDLEQADGPRPVRLRWFTPEVEVPLCGHATLATSAVLFWRLGYPWDEVVYATGSGELKARLVDGLIQLDLPAEMPVPIDPPLELLSAMGITAFEDVRYAPVGRDLLVRLGSWQEVSDLEPDFQAMMAAPTQVVITGVSVTSDGFPGADFVSRFFAPWLGVDEDPVTGAAHTILGPYWSGLTGKKRMVAVQISRRRGDLVVEVTEGDRVLLTGDASLVLEGEVML
jgi:PhzF family phenazine biosynthesis protein